MHLLSMMTFILLTSLQIVVSSKVQPHLNASTLGVSNYVSQTQKGNDKPSVNIDAVVKDLYFISESSGYLMVHWLPYEYLAALDPDKEYSAHLKKYLSPYIVAYVITDPEEPKKSEKWIMGHCRLQLATGEKLIPLSLTTLPVETMEIVNVYKNDFKEYSGKLAKNINVVVFKGLTSTGLRIVDPMTAGSFTILVDKSSVRFTAPVKSLAPKVKCASCSFVLDAAWQYCPKCSKFIEKKK